MALRRHWGGGRSKDSTRTKRGRHLAMRLYTSALIMVLASSTTSNVRLSRNDWTGEYTVGRSGLRASMSGESSTPVAGCPSQTVTFLGPAAADLPDRGWDPACRAATGWVNA
jgi:hypothetical protein